MSSRRFLDRLLQFRSGLLAAFLMPGLLLAAEGRPCAAEPTSNMPVAYGDVITGANCEITPVSDQDSFQFSGAAGDRIMLGVVIEAGGHPNDVCADLFGPTPGTPALATGCSSTIWGDLSAEIDYTLPNSGVYSVVVYEWGNDGTLDYGLALERRAPPSPAAIPISPVQIITDRVDPRPDLDAYTFPGKSGSVICVVATMTEGAGYPDDVCSELVGANGTTLNSACSASIWGDISAALDQVLPEDGNYSVMVSEWGFDAAVPYNLSLQCMSGACPSLPCSVFANPSYVSGTLNLDFEIISRQPAKWSVWVSVMNYTVPVWSVNVPALTFPVSVPIPGFPSYGTAGVLTTMYAEPGGVLCSDWAVVDTGPMPPGSAEPREDRIRQLLLRARPGTP